MNTRLPADRPDHYAVLGVPHTASADEITRAYHRLVRRHHPDAQHDDAKSDHLRAVLAAYAVLRDPTRRAAYDRRHRPPTPGTSTPRPESRHARQPTIRVGPVRYHGPAHP